MTRPDFKAIAAEIVKLAESKPREATGLIALQLELMFETGRGAGLDEQNESLIDALAKLGRKPS